MTDPKKLITQLQKEFEQNHLVKAFVLVGSQARDDIYAATKYSDMEAYVITKDEDAEVLEKQLEVILQKTGLVLFSFKHAVGFVAVYEDLFRLELPVIKESGLEGLFNRPKAQVVKVLIDKTGGKLEKILAKRPEKIDFAKEFSIKVTNFWFRQILAVQYFKKGEIYNTRAIIGTQISALIWMFELLNDPKILLLETNKRIEQFLTAEQLRGIKEVAPAYDQKEIKQALLVLLEIFPKTIEMISNKYAYSYDDCLEVKIKTKLLSLIQQK
jgi:streptomycin adenylyltransferase